MSIADKQVLLKDAERKLGSVLTADCRSDVMTILADVLVNYDVTISASDTDDSEELLQMYIEAKTIEGCSPGTIKGYRYTIRKLLRTTGVPLRDMTVYHLRSFLMTCQKEGISTATQGTYRYAFCSLFGWLQREGLIRTNPCANLSRIRAAKKVKLPFADEEIERLKEACPTQRDRAVVCFLLATGCRISEACGLNRTDIDFQNLECVVHGKGNKERTVYLDEVAALHLKRYLAGRQDLSPALFVGRGSERLGPDAIRNMLHNIERKTGIENVHPHRFRRTLATNLINRGMPIQEVSAILGHDKIDTTMTYIYIKETSVKNAYRKYA